MVSLTEQEVRDSVQATCTDIIGDYKGEPETDRETLLERMDEETDALFGQLVQHGRIDQYDVQDLVRTAQPCATIIEVGERDAWVEDDAGLWDGLTYGVAASIAYFTLRNLLYEALKDRGHDSNDDRPFAVEEEQASI